MNLHKLALSLTLSVLIAGAGCTTMEGESKMAVGSAPSGAISNEPANGDDLTKALARLEMAEADAAAARAEAEAAKVALARASGSSSANTGQLFPANAVPGHCYARVLIPATFVEQAEQIMVKPESTRIEVSQPEYEWVTEQKLIREKSSRFEVVPAEYKTVTEQVVVKPESTKLVSVPAQYETVTEQVVDKPAHTEWRRNRPHTDRIDGEAGSQANSEVISMVEVPATYKTISRQVQIAPPSVKEVSVPAEYKTVSKTVVVTPATTREVAVPAQYSEVRSLKMVKTGETREITIPAEYETITRRIKTSDESLEWREVVCDANMTVDFVSNLQRALHKEGYFDSPVDGIYQRLTQNGINRYARNNNMPFGNDFITLEVISALGISYQ